MATKTAILNVRMDAKVKKAAQKAADAVGVPLSVVVNAKLRDFAAHPRVELEPLEPSKKLKRWIREAEDEYRSGRMKKFASMEELIADLRS
jgi:antitoxin component of RelBE/YafQ-DinJ toxin-antitoxin module